MMNNRWMTVAVLVVLVLVSAVVLRSSLEKSVSANGPQPPALA